MKRILIGMIVLLIIGAAVFGVGVFIYKTGNNQIIGEPLTYVDKDFSTQNEIKEVNLSLSGCHNVILERGEECSLSYSQSEVANITISDEEGVLKMVEKRDWKPRLLQWYRKEQKNDLIVTLPENTKISLVCNFSEDVTLTLPQWEFGNISLKVSGVANVVSQSTLKGENVTLDISGFCSLDLNGEFSNFDVKTSGAAEMKINGSAQIFNLKSSGAVDFDSDGFNCPQISLTSSGTSNISLRGEGSLFSAKVSGYCSFNAGDFNLSTLDLDTSGSVDMTVNVKDIIKSSSSGTVKVNYYGNPEIVKTGSANGKFNKIG